MLKGILGLVRKGRAKGGTTQSMNGTIRQNTAMQIKKVTKTSLLPIYLYTIIDDQILQIHNQKTILGQGPNLTF